MWHGYKIPRMDLWARVWIPFVDPPDMGGVLSFFGPFYFPCGFKESAFSGITLAAPKWTAVRPAEMNPRGVGMKVQVAGWGHMWGTILGVADIGAGFPNEYRRILVFFPSDETENGVKELFIPAVDTSIVPPEGAAMLGTQPPDPDWVLPNIPDFF